MSYGGSKNIKSPCRSCAPQFAFKTLEYKDDLLGENDLTRMDHKNKQTNKRKSKKRGDNNRRFNKPNNKSNKPTVNRNNSNQKPRGDNQGLKSFFRKLNAWSIRDVVFESL